jgi:TPR repeat protein
VALALIGMLDLDPELFPKAVAKGVDLLRRGVTDFPKWSRAMVYQFGEPIRPHLERLWRDVQEESKKPPIAAPPPISEGQPSATVGADKCRPRRRWSIPVAIALMAGLLLAGGWIWWRGRPALKRGAGAADPAEIGRGSNSLPGFELLEPEVPDGFIPDDLAGLLARAEKGDAEAQLLLAGRYYFGDGVRQDYAEAARWLRKAAERGNPIAQNNLGVCYEKGEGVAKDSAEAVKWYRKAADQGDATAQNNLGVFYLKGEGVAKDSAEAVKWYRKAADQGDATAQYNLGGCYDKGEGVPKDSAEAVKWYRKAADQGYAYAQNNLGVCYEKGEGVAKDSAEAVKWYRKAADQGYATAQYNLGGCYGKGEGVPQNDVEAYKWFSLAAAQGHKKSAEWRDWVSQRMARAEVVEGQRRAAAFVARAESPGDSGGFSIPAQPRFADPGLKACGTAFFVSVDGYLLSNYHVVEGASTVKVKTSSGILRASVVKTDPVNDIAVLKVSGSFRALPLASRREVKLGETVFTVGFPNIQLQGREPKLTKGEISSLSGAQDDPRHFQISVAVQPGNSGGPLVDGFGNVIGIVTAQLSDAAALRSAGRCHRTSTTPRRAPTPCHCWNPFPD